MQPVQPQQPDEDDIVKEEPLMFNAVEAQQREFLEHAFEGFKTPDPELYFAEVPEKLSLADK